MKTRKPKVNKLPIFLNTKAQDDLNIRFNSNNRDDFIRVRKILQNGDFYTIRNISKLVVLALLNRNLNNPVVSMGVLDSIATMLDNTYRVNIMPSYVHAMLTQIPSSSMPLTSPGIANIFGLEYIVTQDLDQYLLTNESVLVCQGIQVVVDRAAELETNDV